MTEKSEKQDDLTPAEAEFVEFLAGQDREPPLDFETFVRERKPLELELRRLHGEWLEIARVLGKARDESPRNERDAAPSVHADDNDVLELEFAGELIQRLARERDQAGRFEPKGEIARGGMGIVSRVFDPRLRRNLAMKVILARRDHATPEERARAMHRATARFMEEAQITSQLDHPGVVPVHDLGIDAQGRLYFTMRLVKGRDFRQILGLMQRGAEGWTATRALGVILRVCEAIAYAHSKGVIHRDLKPANVMVGRFGEVYVMDWGLARVLGRPDPHDLRVQVADAGRIETDARNFQGQTPGSPLLTMDGRVVGTPSFMSPEQAKGQVAEIGPPTDVYAIGALLYQLLTGQTPYAEPGANLSPRQIHALLLAGPPTPVRQLAPDTPAELIAICEKAMARDPGRRYADPLAVAREIEAYLERRPVAAVAASFGYVARLFFERNRILSTVVAAAVVALLALGGLAWRNDRRAYAATLAYLDSTLPKALIEEERALRTPTPSHLGELRDWLRRADGVAQIGERRRAGEADHVALAADRASLESADRDLAHVADLRGAIERRVATAERIAAANDPAQWARAAAEIAELPIYRGLELTPQEGLVPLGPNRQGLWEFWHVATGAAPHEPDADHESRWLSEESGVVLILVPGGRYTIGSPASEPDRDDDETLHDVDLAPCFLSKFEVTQAQWERVMGANPSRYRPGTPLETIDLPDEERSYVTALHPVESVSFDDVREFVAACDLSIVDEAQWETACRAGSREAYVLGPTIAALSDRENIADVSNGDLDDRSVDWDDGWPITAPVGWYEPNAWGFHDMLGNVSEWCSDVYSGDAITSTPSNAGRFHVVRGGSWFAKTPSDRAANQMNDLETGRNQACGFRPARPFR